MTARENTRDADNLTEIRAAIYAAREAWDERGEVVIDSGRSYLEGEPVVIRLRKRGRRYDLNDEGAATRIGGRPDGWLEVADGVVAEQGFNINRRGVVFVPVGDGRDLAALVSRLAEASLAVCSAMLELDQRR